MTLIAAVTDGRVVHMIGDRRLAAQSGGFSTSALPKCCSVNLADAELIIGSCGKPGMARVAASSVKHADMFRLDTTHADAVEIWMTDFRSNVLRGLVDSHIIKNATEHLPGALLIGYKGQIFQMQGDGAMLHESSPYQAIGSGKDYFLGYAAGKRLKQDGSLDPEQVSEPYQFLLQGGRVAAMFHTSVGAPFDVLDTVGRRWLQMS